MNKVILPNKFVDILKSLNVYDEYVDNIKTIRCRNGNYATDSIMGILGASFNWSESPQGNPYWSDIASKIKERCQK